MLRCAGATYAYRRGRPVLGGVSAEFAPGRIAVVVGPNGSGKSTLARLLIGALAPSSGEVTLDGVAVRAWPARALASRVAYVAQRPSVGFDFSARRVVALGRQSVEGSASAHASAVERALERVELGALADEAFGALSVGQQQRVSLARALAQLDQGERVGRVLVADEPMSALDPRHAALAERTLRELAGAGVAVVLVLHDLGAAARLADDALVLSPGAAARLVPAVEALTPERLGAAFDCEFDTTGRPMAPGVGGTECRGRGGDAGQVSDESLTWRPRRRASNWLRLGE